MRWITHNFRSVVTAYGTLRPSAPVPVISVARAPRFVADASSNVPTLSTSGPGHLLALIDERAINGGDLAGDGGSIRLEDEFAVEVWHGFDDRVEVHPHRPLFPPSILHNAHEQRPLRRVDEVLAGEPGPFHTRLAGASLGKTLHARCVKLVRQEAIGVGDGKARRFRLPASLGDTLEIVEERLAARDIAALVEVVEQDPAAGLQGVAIELHRGLDLADTLLVAVGKLEAATHEERGRMFGPLLGHRNEPRHRLRRSFCLL